MKTYAVMSVGPILTAIGLWLKYRNKNVNSWLKDRRIDNKPNTKDFCPDCGAHMKKKVNYTGERKGLTAKVCSKYPDCQMIKWEGRDSESTKTKGEL